MQPSPPLPQALPSAVPPQAGPSPAPAPPPRSRRATALALAAVGAAVLLGAVLRLEDPLSSPVVPAEDPYMHMALVREHLRTGALDPINLHQNVYPPGLHAFLASAWVLTGLDLYGLVLFGPAVLGAVGVAGVALLLWGRAGPVAAFVGALACAVAPETIFRTTMMSPTALDLAVLPFFLHALLRILAGRLGWMGVAVPTAAFLALAHPWLLAILCATGLLFLATLAAFPWPAGRGHPISMKALAAGVSVLGAGLGVALLMPGFDSTLGLPRTDLSPLWILLAAAAQVPIFVAVSRPVAWADRILQVPLLPARMRLGLSAGIAAALLATTLAATSGGLPEHVDLPRMLGWPALALAVGALVALPFLASPLANLSAALFAATFPFVVFNPLGSAFLPHRTVVYLGLALVLLAGVAAGGLARAAAQALAARAARSPAAGRAPPRAALRSLGPALLVATLLGGTVYAGTPDPYPGGWYRLYTPCELDALREVAAQADADPDAVLVAGSWQAKLVLAALTEDTTRVWYTREVFTSDSARAKHLDDLHRDGRSITVVLDRHLRTEAPGTDTGFTASPPWSPAGAWCSEGLAHPRLAAFTSGGPA